MSVSDRVARELEDLRAGREQPDLQMDVLDAEVPTLEGELDITRNQEEAEYIDALQGLRELQSGDPVRWKVWRIDNSAGDRRLNGFIAEVGTSELRQEYFADKWGGGKYRVRGTFSNGKFAGGKTIDIAGDVKPSGNAASAPMNAAMGSGFDMQAWMAFQAQQDAKREERARQDRKEFLALALPIAGQIAAALIGRAAPAQPDLAGLITALRPTVAPPDPMDSMRKMAETMAVLQKLNGGGDGDSISSIATALAPYAAPVLGALAARPSPAPVRFRRPLPGSQPSRPAQVIEQPVVPPPSPVPTPTHTGVDLNAPSTAFTPEQQSMFAQVKPQVDSLVQMARENADPVEAANVFFELVMLNEQTTDAAYNQIADLIMDSGALNKLAVLNTGVREYAPFFQAFQRRLSERILEETQAAQNVG